MDPAETLLELYKQRLAGLSNLLANLPTFVREDEAAKVILGTPLLEKYRIDRILQLCGNILKDEKQLTIITILQAMHRTADEKHQLQTALNKQLVIRRELQIQLSFETNRVGKKEAPGSSKDLATKWKEPHNDGLAQKLKEFKLLNQQLQTEVNNLRVLLARETEENERLRMAQNNSVEVQKTQLEGQQLKSLRQYWLGEMKKTQMKYNQRQLQCESLQQKQLMLEQQNFTLSASVRRLTTEMEHLRQSHDGISDNMVKSLRADNNRLVQQLQVIHSKNQLEIQSLTDTISKLRHSNDTEKELLQRDIRHLREQQSQHVKIMDDKNAELRKLLEQVERLKQEEQKLNYGIKLKTQKLQKTESELDMKRKQINKLSQIFDEERRGYELALKDQKEKEKTRRLPYMQRYGSPSNRRNYQSNVTSYFSPQHRAGSKGHISKFGERLDTQEFEEVNQQISRLQSELSSLRTGFELAKNKSKISIQDNLRLLRRGMHTLRRSIQKIVRLTQDQMRKMMLALENKVHKILTEEKNEHKAKIEKVKQLCEEQILLITEKLRLQQTEKDVEIGKLIKELSEREHKIKAYEADNQKTKQIIETSQHLESSYINLLKQYDELSKKYQQMIHNTTNHERVGRSPPPHSLVPINQQNGYRSYSRPKERQLLKDKNVMVQTRSGEPNHLHNSRQRELGMSSVLMKSKEDSMRIDANRREQHVFNIRDKILETEIKPLDPILKKLDDDSHPLDNSRRVQLQNGFTQLEDEIEAIIQRRNKRNNKHIK